MEVTGFAGLDEVVVSASTGTVFEVVKVDVVVQSSHGLSVPLCDGQVAKMGFVLEAEVVVRASTGRELEVVELDIVQSSHGLSVPL